MDGLAKVIIVLVIILFAMAFVLWRIASDASSGGNDHEY